MTILDAHRYRPLEGGPSFPLTHRLFRLAWQLTWLILAAWTPPPMTAWRRAVLRAFGARLAAKTEVRSSARVWYPPNLTMDACSMIGPGAICYNMAPVRIGQRTVVSQRAHLCTGSHDVSDPFFQLVVRGITLEDDVWVAAEAFVGPGVTARQGAILGRVPPRSPILRLGRSIVAIQLRLFGNGHDAQNPTRRWQIRPSLGNFSGPKIL